MCVCVCICKVPLFGDFKGDTIRVSPLKSAHPYLHVFLNIQTRPENLVTQLRLLLKKTTKKAVATSKRFFLTNRLLAHVKTVGWPRPAQTAPLAVLRTQRAEVAEEIKAAEERGEASIYPECFEQIWRAK